MTTPNAEALKIFRRPGTNPADVRLALISARRDGRRDDAIRYALAYGMFLEGVDTSTPCPWCGHRAFHNVFCRDFEG